MRRLTSDQLAYLAGLAVMLACAGLVLCLIGWALASGQGQCPSDLGAKPSTTLDGRTVCVVPAGRGR